MPDFDAKDRVDILSSMLDRMDGWVRYAETKNGILLTLAFATLGVGLRLGNGENWCSFVPRVLWLTGVAFCVFSILILFFSFVPKLGKWYEFFVNKVGRRGRSSGLKTNLVFFDHLAGLTESEVEKGLSEMIGLQPRELSCFEKDLVGQVHANAKVARRKFKAFAPAAYLFGFGLISIISAFTLY